MENGEVLEAKAIDFSYSSSFPVLHDVGFKLSMGETLAVLGPNGCGKTTLLKVLVGLLPLQKGEILINGERLSSHERTEAFAFVPQTDNPTWSYSVHTMVLLGRARYMGTFSRPSKADWDAAEQAINLLGIDHLKDKSFNQLSGGERRLVIIARALASEAHTLVFDEPTSSLDIKNQYKSLILLRDLCIEKGYSVIFSSHDPSHALYIADRVLLFAKDGRTEIGTASELITEERIHEAYGIEVKITEVLHEGEALRCVVPLVKTKRFPRPGERG